MIENHWWFGPERKVSYKMFRNNSRNNFSCVLWPHFHVCGSCLLPAVGISYELCDRDSHGNSLRSATVGVFVVVISKHSTSELLNPALSQLLNFQQHTTACSQTLNRHFLLICLQDFLGLAPPPPPQLGCAPSWQGGVWICSVCLSSLPALGPMLVPQEEHYEYLLKGGKSIEHFTFITSYQRAALVTRLTLLIPALACRHMENLSKHWKPI